MEDTIYKLKQQLRLQQEQLQQITRNSVRGRNSLRSKGARGFDRGFRPDNQNFQEISREIDEPETTNPRFPPAVPPRENVPPLRKGSRSKQRSGPSKRVKRVIRRARRHGLELSTDDLVIHVHIYMCAKCLRN